MPERSVIVSVDLKHLLAGPPDVDYPEGHGPYCRRECDHSSHDAYDEWKVRLEDALTLEPTEVPHCAGRSSSDHQRIPMVPMIGGWRCGSCGELWPEENAGGAVERSKVYSARTEAPDGR